MKHSGLCLKFMPIPYLDQSRGATKLSMGDLQNVLNGWNNNLFITDDVSMSSFNITEHTDQRAAEVNKDKIS